MGLNKHVDFSTAKLLKEKGFNLKVVNFYNYERLSLVSDKDRKIDELVNYNPINWNSVKDHHTSAPTIAEVVMWLYEKHGVWIEAPFWDSKFRIKIINTIEEKLLRGIDSEGYNSPTEAYEAAIEYTLNNLI